jgi:hypothetical protein
VYLFGIAEASALNVGSSNKNCPTAKHASAANILCRDVYVIKKQIVSLITFYTMYGIFVISLNSFSGVSFILSWYFDDLLAGQLQIQSQLGLEIFLYSTVSRPTMGPIQPHIQCA